MDKDIHFEDKLWKAADKLRKKVEVHEYKYVVLGLIFLRYLSYRYDEAIKELKKEFSSKIAEAPAQYQPIMEQAIKDKDHYRSKGVLMVPEEAHWNYLIKNANQPNIGELIDRAIELLEREYPKELKDVIPKRFTQINLDSHDLAYLINLFT
ncbi:MAG: type I restriction-modification system subunit M N-terminal domain-containing protein, partial [Thermodesulfovibrio sp.]|nr:type I restriction-modification system subunit M N-terminal domain-containing protein [Thermodesulfovibrio sp.]